MKHNLIKIFLSFFATFFAATLLVSIIDFKPYPENETAYSIKQRIYAVLRKDAQNRQERIEKNELNIKDKNINALDHFVTKRGWIDLAKATNEIDTRQLPEEFKRAWRKYASTLTETAQTHSQMPEPSQFKYESEELRNWNNAVSEQIQAWSEVVSISKRYGLKFDQYDNFLVENQ